MGFDNRAGKFQEGSDEKKGVGEAGAAYPGTFDFIAQTPDGEWWLGVWKTSTLTLQLYPYTVEAQPEWSR